MYKFSEYISLQYIGFQCSEAGRDKSRGFEKKGVGHHSWPTMKTLGLGWSKMAKITLETINFWRNISFSLFKFSKFSNAFIKKEKKHSCSSQWEKDDWKKVYFVL